LRWLHQIVLEIPIYYVDKLDAQLDEVCAHFLVQIFHLTDYLFFPQLTRIAVENFIEVDVMKKTVTMPKLPSSDYQIHRNEGQAGAVSKTSSGSSVDCLAVLTPLSFQNQESCIIATAV
jgi:hypothetical protein